MITLRDYQQQGVNDCIIALKNSPRKRVVFECPTGGGKTVIFSYIVQQAIKKGSNVLILTDREELLRGTGGTLQNFGVNPEYIRAGRKIAPNKAGVFVAMAQTLKNRLTSFSWLKWLETINLVIIDEAHKQEFNVFFQKDIFENKTVIGFSATPKRGGKMRALGMDYDDIVHTNTVVELIEKGFLMPDMYFGSPIAPDMKGVKMNSQGDYSESDMFSRYNTPKLYGGVIEAWQAHANNTISLVFCTNIIHCVKTCKEFEKAGIKARFLCSKLGKPTPPANEPIPTNADEEKTASPDMVRYLEKLNYYNEYIEAYNIYSGPRELLINKWKQGEFKVMINAGILTTGFDFPAIETVVLFRATVSETLYLQMLGRGSRPSENKTHFNILDFGKNAERLGGYKLRRKWGLFHESKKGAGVPAVKECDPLREDKRGKKGCGDYVLAQCVICPTCGFVFKVEKEAEKIELEFMFEDINKGKFRAIKPISAMSFEEIELFQKANKYKPQWLYNQLYIRGGREEIESFARFKNYSRGYVDRIIMQVPNSIKKENEILENRAII